MFRLCALRLRLEHETQAYTIIDCPLIMAVDQEMGPWDFPLDPVVKNPPSSAGDTGLSLGHRAKVSRDSEQLSPCTATTKHLPQLEKIPSVTAKTQHNQINKYFLKKTEMDLGPYRG